MKRNENKKIVKESQSKLSPSHRKKNVLSHNIFKDFEMNGIALSPKKSQDELFIPKKKLVPNTSNHKRTKSNSDNYIQYTTNNNINLNSKLSFTFRRKKENKNNKELSSPSRNKNINDNLDELKKTNNLLYTSFSLKDFRNHIINTFSNHNLHETKNDNKYSNIINLKNNNLVFSFDNIITNIEDTRNTTSITGFNNGNLLYSKPIKNKDDQNAKSTKYIKIHKKQNNQLYFCKNNSSKIISYTNNNIIKEKISPKTNLHRYIYKYNNIKTNKNNSKLNSTNNLILTKKTFRNSQKHSTNIHKDKKLYINAVNESDFISNLNYFNNKKNSNNDINTSRFTQNMKKSLCSSTTNNSINKNKRKDYKKYKKRKTKSQENNFKMGINENTEFKSVEEIHFMFVRLIQRKKAFFERNNIDKIKEN